MDNLLHPLFLLPAITFAGFLGYVVYRWYRVRQKMNS